jgi:hypothetical protein
VVAEVPKVVVSKEFPETTIAVGVPVSAVEESEVPAPEIALILT